MNHLAEGNPGIRTETMVACIEGECVERTNAANPPQPLPGGRSVPALIGRSSVGVMKWALAALVLLCAGMAAGQDAALSAAVVKCLQQEATGACACAGTSCSADPRFTGVIGAWDTSGVRDMWLMCVLRWG